MSDSDLNITIAGKLIPVRTSAEYDEVITYMQMRQRLLFRADASTDAQPTNPRYIGMAIQIGRQEAERRASKEATPTPGVPTEHEAHERTSVGAPDERQDLPMTDWLLRAWDFMGRPGNGMPSDQFYYVLTHDLGFKSYAKNPKKAIKSALAASNCFVRIGKSALGSILWRLDEEAVRRRRENETTEARRIITPPPGERMIDYAQRASERIGRPATVRELISKMQELGWHGEGDVMSSVASTLTRPRYRNRVRRIGMNQYLIGSENQFGDLFDEEAHPNGHDPAPHFGQNGTGSHASSGGVLAHTA